MKEIIAVCELVIEATDEETEDYGRKVEEVVDLANMALGAANIPAVLTIDWDEPPEVRDVEED